MDICLNLCSSSQDYYLNEDPNLECKPKTEEPNLDYKPKRTGGPLLITDLPPEIIEHILRNLSFDTISKIRIVCKYFNEISSSVLNFEFSHLRTMMLQKFQTIKSLMPRRESARRKHPLARESDIVETLHMRLSLLHMTFGKHIERNYCCFFPGEIIDEIYRILKYIKITPSLNRAYKVTDELFDLSTMAMEYFKENIEPFLPEISYLAHDILEHSSFITPGSELAAQRAQLMQLEYTNVRKDINQPKNDSLIKFQKQLRNTREIAKKNRRDIVKIKQSLKSAKKRVNSVITQLQEIKWQQKNCEKSMFPEYCNINDFLLGIRRRRQELLKISSFSNCLNNKSSTSKLTPETSVSVSHLSSCEEFPANLEKIRSILSKTSTTITCIPLNANEEIDCSSKVPENSEMHMSIEDDNMSD